MTLLDLIPVPKFQGIPRLVRGSCSVKDKDDEDRNEALIRARDAERAKRRRERGTVLIDGVPERFVIRKRRHDKIINYVKTVIERYALTEAEIGERLDIPKTTIAHDMARLRESGEVQVKKAGRNGRVYWNG